MQTRRYAILPILFILFSSVIVPHSYASVESEAQEDIQAGCPDGEMLVYRTTSKQYVCVEPSTAERWEELGIANIISQYFETSENEISEIIAEEEIEISTPSPLPPKKPHISLDDSECRSGYTLVYRFIHHDTFCTSPSTALSWERLGLAEIVNGENLIDASETREEETREEETREEETREEETREEETREEETREEETREEETREEETREEETREEETREEETREEETREDSTNYITNIINYPTPKIHELEGRIWVAVGYDYTNIVLIEGDTGIIVIDSLSTYELSKKALEDFRNISDNPIKTIIYTKLTPGNVESSKAFLEEGDGSVEIIASEELLFLYNEKYNLDAGVTHPFTDVFSLDISGVKMKLSYGAGGYSDQTYILLPDDDGLLIGDSIHAVLPVMLDLDYLQNLFNE